MTLSGSSALLKQGPEPGGEDDRATTDSAHASVDVHERLGALYRQHSGSLVRQLARHTGCSETARELAHEAFLRFLGLPAWRAALIRRPEAYLHRISTNLLRDWGRSRIPERCAELPHFARDVPVDQVAALESRDTLRRLETAVSRLRPKTRAIFLAHRLDGLSYAEIAERTGLSVKGVEKQMSKAIAKIDRLLDRS